MMNKKANLNSLFSQGRGFAKFLLYALKKPGYVIRNIRGTWVFIRHLMTACRAKTYGDFPFGKLYPCLSDRYEQSGMAKGHYFHQDLYVARKIHDANPEKHIDVGSRVDGFVAHVASFREIIVMDVRPISSKVHAIRFVQGDLMADLPVGLASSADSVSCLHALEHMGLGRYGDPLRADGHQAALNNLTRILKPGGTLYLSVPIGTIRIEFDAHRVFSIAYLLKMTTEQYELVSFAYVDDAGDLHQRVTLSPESIASSMGCRYGCGIFELRKKY